MSIPALFLDRDGVINLDHGYVHKTENFIFKTGIFELVRLANLNCYKVIVVTNQAGIGRGYFKEEQFIQLTQWMFEQFRMHNAYVDAVYYCPSHPEFGVGKYRRASEFRKPGAGMLFRAKNDYDIDLSKSIFVGDNDTDMAAGKTAGIGSLFKIGGNMDFEGAFSVNSLNEVILECGFKEHVNLDLDFFKKYYSPSVFGLL